MHDLQSESWLSYLEATQQELVKLSYTLYDREKSSGTSLADYAFVVFPMAKAYEGFLKRYLYDSQLISQEQYTSKRFRIGRALNPDLHMNQRDENWLFDDLERSCGKEMAQLIWQTWLTCRNRVFHFFPNEDQFLSLEGAKKNIELLADAMEAATLCQIEQHAV